jgi:hypothetical protein
MFIVRNRSQKLLWLHQGRYVRDVVGRFGMAEARGISAPMARETRLSRGEEAGEVTDRPYAEVVGSLMYLMTCTRPDLPNQWELCHSSCQRQEVGIGRRL